MSWTGRRWLQSVEMCLNYTFAPAGNLATMAVVSGADVNNICEAAQESIEKGNIKEGPEPSNFLC